MSCPFMRSNVATLTAAAANQTLPPGHPPIPPTLLPTFTLDTLRDTATLATSSSSSSVSSSTVSATSPSPPLLVSVKGAIFDVSLDSRFQFGGRWRQAIGRDLTRTLAFETIHTTTTTNQTLENSSSSSSSSSSPTSNVPSSPLHLETAYQGRDALSGLNFDQLRTLETWYKLFEDSFQICGRLLTEEEAKDVETNTEFTRPGEEMLQPLPSDIYGSFLPLIQRKQISNNENQTQKKTLHQLIDEDEQQETCSFLAELPLASIALVDVVCPRSGMAPIHKAIEKGWLDVVKLLIDKNANIEIECVLYDNERPLQLAKRFHFEQAVELLQEHAALATANKKTDTTTTI